MKSESPSMDSTTPPTSPPHSALLMPFVPPGGTVPFDTVQARAPIPGGVKCERTTVRVGAPATAVVGTKSGKDAAVPKLTKLGITVDTALAPVQPVLPVM